MLKNWWLYQLNVTDRTNIVCFIITMVISAICIVIAKKMNEKFADKQTEEAR